MAERKDRMALLSRYSKFHTVKYEQKPSLNLNVEQWAADALIESYGIAACYDFLEYYFSVAQSPSWNYFAYNTEKILQARLDKQQDDKERAERRQMAKEWLKSE
jgi:hypothetical protein